MESADPEKRRSEKKTGEMGAEDVFRALRGRPVYIETYGCRYNFGDSAKLAEVLRSIGCTLVNRPRDAGAIVVNTCTVVSPTERRMLRRLSALRDRELYVTGCMPAVQADAIYAVCSPRFIAPGTIHELYRSVRTVSGKGVGIVQLARGCTGRCTYCLTRLARGCLVSFSEDEILSHIHAYVRAGVTEIQLTAQDASAWGKDSGRSFPNLLRAIDRIPGNHMIRVGMMNPATVREQTDAIVDTLAGDHFYKFVHLPIQSGSDYMLCRMGRDYTVAEFEEIVRSFRKRHPSITIATDMIVGFPGESEDDFSSSLDLIRRVKPAKVNVTRYSRRPFTCPDGGKEYPEYVKKDRSRIIHAVAEKVYTANNTDQLGKVVPFLVTETLRKGSVMARTPEYAGIVIRENLPCGCRGHAILTEDRKYFFIGERVPACRIK